MQWRAKYEEIGYEDRTAVTAEAVAALDEARRMSPGTADALRDPSKC